LINDGVYDYPIGADDRQTIQDSEFRVQVAGNITADPTNAQHLAIIWSDMRDSTYPLSSSDPYQVKTNADIIVSQSFDGGQTWFAPTAIQAPGDQFQPWGAYNASGQLQVGYYDRSYDPANHKYGFTLASETDPGSLNFTFQQVTTVLSDPTRDCGFPWAVTVNTAYPHPTPFVGDYCGITIVPGTNKVAALWTDLREQSVYGGYASDAFFALVDPSSASPAPTTAAKLDPATAVAGGDLYSLGALTFDDKTVVKKNRASTSYIDSFGV
jgi:hypothetical protein